MIEVRTDRRILAAGVRIDAVERAQFNRGESVTDANGDAARNQTEALNAIRGMLGQSGWIEPDGLESALVYDTATWFSGTFCAEHGVGMAKLKEMVLYKPETEIELMRTLKRAIDPMGLMNPGKVLKAD